MHHGGAQVAVGLGPAIAPTGAEFNGFNRQTRARFLVKQAMCGSQNQVFGDQRGGAKPPVSQLQPPNRLPPARFVAGLHGDQRALLGQCGPGLQAKHQ
jgi:hypothetical protein